MASILNQDILSSVPTSIFLRKLTLQTSGAITQHVRDNAVAVVGVSLCLSSTGSVDAIAFATSDVVFHLGLAGKGKQKQNQTQVLTSNSKAKTTGRTELERVLDSPHCVLAGFGMARIALHLYRHFGVHVRGVDLSTLFARSTRTPQTPAEFASSRIDPGVRRHRIHALWYHHEEKDVWLRAWLSAVLARDSLSEIEGAARVHTQNLRDTELRCLAEMMMNVELLEAARPTRMESEFEHVEMDEDGQLVIRNARFNARVRPSKQTSVVLETAHGDSIVGHAVRAEGKQTGIKVAGGNFQGGVERIRVIGREELTNAELARDEFVLLLLQGEIASLAESPFVSLVWFPSGVPRRSVDPWAGMALRGIRGSAYPMLNASQREVVHAMWSEGESLVVAHGPPGTGKTTTIAAALERWDCDEESTWVIAQSNVGVKNIARTLIKYAVDFKLIVSKEFYVEWHEHLYESIEERLIRSDDLFSDPVDTERKLGGSKTILSTISMLSNPALDNCGVYRIAPVERLIVDEASQIDAFELVHLFHKFKHLEKVCMFGDPKQLPPYGQESAPQMKTIFDIKHLKPSAYFLNTQYRMPVPLGQFISEEVYNSKLKSEHKIVDRSCVSFVDVRKGQEQSVGSSWRNTEEVHAVVNIVKNYYRSVDFCVITPYDGQRAAIVGGLKAEKLPWECVYNVDSFQGHEAAYVIVSTVRTSGAGFLKSLNRMNVMLTRCKAGMVLVTNRNFLYNAGRDTLLGRLAQCWGAGRDVWVDPRALIGRSVGLPGMPQCETSIYTSSPVPISPAKQLVAGSPARVVPGAWPGTAAFMNEQSRNRLVPPLSDSQEHRENISVVGYNRPRAHTDASHPSSLLSSVPGSGRQTEALVGSLAVPSSPSKGVWPASRMRFEEHFPTLDGLDPSNLQSRVRGRWRAGSGACRL